MTTYEHIMIGVNGTLAMGLHERHGWKIVAMAGAAAAIPDADGLTWFLSNDAFSTGHRVWLHNVLACLVTGVLVGVLDYRWDIVTRGGRMAIRFLRLRLSQDSLALRRRREHREQQVWVLVATASAMTQLPADLVVSGTRTLPVWGLKLLWPFSDREWSCQMVTYNDPGAIILFISGMFALARWPSHRKLTARATLVLVTAYLLFRGLVWHERPFGA